MIVDRIEGMPTTLKKLLLFGIDVVAIICAYFLANIFQDYSFDFISIAFFKTCFFAITVYGFAFYSTRIYKRRLRYSSAFDYVSIGVSAPEIIWKIKKITSEEYLYELTIKNPSNVVNDGEVKNESFVAPRRRRWLW